MKLSNEHKKLIERTGTQVGLNINQAILDKLEVYCQQVLTWIEKHNVTGLRTMEHIVYDGIMDTLYMMPFLVGKQILDIGSGAGLPGMIISIVCPELHVTMSEMRSKKLAFLKRGARECKVVERVEIVDARTEGLEPKYDCVTSRAFSSLEQTIHHCKAGTRPTGRMLLPRSYTETEDCLVRGGRVFTYNKYDKKDQARILAIFDQVEG